MDKEQFDHIDLFFRQAAMNVSPPVNDEAWRKMEVLLDREFRKKRRRGIIWWFILTLFFLILGGAIFYHNHPQPVNIARGVNGTSSISIPADRTKSPDNSRGLKQQNQPQGIPPTGNEKIPAYRQDKKAPSDSIKRSLQNADAPVIAGNGKSVNVIDGPLKKPKIYYAGLDNYTKVRTRNSEKKSGSYNSQDDPFPVKSLRAKLTLSELTSKPEFHLQAKPHIDPGEGISAIDKSMRNTLPDGSHASVKVKRERRFYFVGAISPNASAVGKIHLDKFNSRIGFGAGYQLTKKISLQTGMYAGRMIYTAGEGDYTVKPGSYISKIIKINADCYFYNVPVSIRYDTWQLKKYNLYAVGGLSSFWSKNETYDYHFLNSNGAYRTMVSSYKNNKNLFSTINLSIGVERSLSKVLFLQAEPYLLVPVSGVGEGNVKLHSAGLQFGIKYKPLRK